MSLNIGTLVGYIELDASGAVTGVRKAEEAIGGLAGASKKATEEVGKTGQATGSVFQRVATLAQENQREWRTAGAGLATYGASMTALGLGVLKTGIEYNQLRQRSTAALTAIMGSGEAAANQMDRLDEFATNSPFSRAVFIEAQQQLLAFGTEADRVVPILDAIQNAVAATGGSNQDIAELTRIIAQVGSTGRLTASDLNQLGVRGVNAAKLIGDQMGMTEAEIRDSITRGTLDANDALIALTDGMQDAYGGAAAGVKETMDGAVDRVKAAVRDISAAFATVLVNPEGGGFLVDAFNKLADFLRWFETLPEGVKNSVFWLGLGTGALALFGGAAMLALPKILAFSGAVKTLSAQAGGLSGIASGIGRTVFGPWGIAIAGVTTALGFFISSQMDAARAADEFKGSLDETTGALTDQSYALTTSLLQSGGALEWLGDNLRELGLAESEVVRSIAEGGDVRDQLLASLEAEQAELHSLIALYAERDGSVRTGIGVTQEEVDTLLRRRDVLDSTISGIRDESAAREDAQASKINEIEINKETERALQQEAMLRGEVKSDIDALTGSHERLQGATENSNQATAEAEPVLKDYETRMDEATRATRDAWDATKALAEVMGDVIAQAKSALDANIAYEASLDKLTETIKENGKNHDISTEKGRNNMSALSDLAGAARRSAEENLKNGESLKNVTSDMEDAREAFIRGAERIGMTEQAAKELANELGLTSEAVVNLHTEVDNVQDKKVQVSVETAMAEANVATVQRSINGVTGKTVNVNVVTNYSSVGSRPQIPVGGNRIEVANGGIIKRDGGGVDEAGRLHQRRSMLGGPAFGRTNILWGEPETGKEAYISAKPGMEAQNVAFLREAASWFGLDVIRAASRESMAPAGAAPASTAAASAMSAAPTQVVNITANYPQAEPATRRAQKFGEQYMAGVMGG